ncbi:MAG TPA: hypothetical protein VKA01_11060 [Vicinamibacteria bacterium]|nr:hypothetical protein [Vicinamibacteria bacterium]
MPAISSKSCASVWRPESSFISSWSGSFLRRISRAESPSLRQSSRSSAALGGVLKMSTVRKFARFFFRKSTDFRHEDHVGLV